MRFIVFLYVTLVYTYVHWLMRYGFTVGAGAKLNCCDNLVEHPLLVRGLHLQLPVEVTANGRFDASNYGENQVLSRDFIKFYHSS